MSDDPTEVYRRPPEQPASGPRPAVLVVAAVLVLVLLGLLVVLWLQDRPDPLVHPPEATPTPQLTPTPDPTPTPEPTPTPSPTPSPTPEERPEPEDREPTDSDAASFAARYRPPGAEDIESITADVNGDGHSEVVFVSREEGRSRIDVAVWTGRHYEAIFADRGGDAEEVVRFHVHDFTGTGTREIVVVQRAGDERESLSVWGWEGETVARQRAQAGCWAGSHTYGIVGATIVQGEIRATCDGSPLPRQTWPTDVYVWDGEVWRYDRTER